MTRSPANCAWCQALISPRTRHGLCRACLSLAQRGGTRATEPCVGLNGRSCSNKRPARSKTGLCGRCNRLAHGRLNGEHLLQVAALAVAAVEVLDEDAAMTAPDRRPQVPKPIMNAGVGYACIVDVTQEYLSKLLGIPDAGGLLLSVAAELGGRLRLLVQHPDAPPTSDGELWPVGVLTETVTTCEHGGVIERKVVLDIEGDLR